MRASRLLAILILLQLRTRLTGADLAEEFEVSLRTIYRDIDALSAAGVPVYADKGPGGGFRLIEGYRTRLTGLDADEAEALTMIGLPGPADSLGLGAAAARARGKLLAALPPSAVEGADRIVGRFHLDSVDWYRAADEAPHLATLARAVLDERRVEMTYESWSGVRNWIAAPLGLVLKGGAWYLVAEARARISTFRVSGIQALVTKDETITRPDGFDLVRYWTESLRLFEEELRPLLAEIRISPDGQRRLKREGAYAERAIGAGRENADGWRTILLPIETVDQAAHLLLGLGVDVDVIGPEILRARVGALARGIADRIGIDQG